MNILLMVYHLSLALELAFGLGVLNPLRQLACDELLANFGLLC